jgi:Fe-Mn family superoxide dismutase
MSFHARPISFKPPRLKGLSARLIASHYENNYGGAVRRLNAIRADLANLDPASAPGFRLNGLKREELIATNSMLLHEAYFEALGEGGGGDPTGALADAIARDFGSLAKWRAEFVAMGRALGGGSGWVVLTRSPRPENGGGTLSNVWAADHTHGLAGGTPVLALDMYEHAYHLDFGSNAVAYVDAFMNNIAWERLANRFAGNPSLRKPHGRCAHRARNARGRSRSLGD